MELKTNKDEILRISTELFALKGYDAVGVQEIVDKCGITKPTLYYYFKSKLGVLQEILNLYEDSLLAELVESKNNSNDFIDFLQKSLKTQIKFAKNNLDFFRLHISLLNTPEMSEANSVFSPKKQELLNFFIQNFTEYSKNFGNMKNKETLYSTIFFMNATSVSMMIAKGDLQESDENIYKIVHSFVYGVAS